MHPATSYHLAQARMSDLRQHAQRDTLAHAARRGAALGRRTPAEFESAAARWRSTMCTHEPPP